MEQNQPSDTYPSGKGSKAELARVPFAGTRQGRAHDPLAGTADLLLDTIVQFLARRVAQELSVSEESGEQQ